MTRRSLRVLLVLGALLTLGSWGSLGPAWRVVAVAIVALHAVAALTFLRFPRLWLLLTAVGQGLVIVAFFGGQRTSLLIGVWAVVTAKRYLAVRDALGDVRDDGVSSATQNLKRGIEGSVTPSSARLRLERHEHRSGGFGRRVAGWSAAIIGGVVAAAVLL